MRKKNRFFTEESNCGKHRLLHVITITALLLSLLIPGFIRTSTACAAKNTFYASQMSGDKKGIKKMKIVDNKLIIWGCLANARRVDKAYDRYNNNEGVYQKYTFKLSKNFKCFATGGLSDPAEYSLEVLKQNYIPHPDLGLGFLLKVRKGKLVTLYTES